jgi:hypothetical protein
VFHLIRSVVTVATSNWSCGTAKITCSSFGDGGLTGADAGVGAGEATGPETDAVVDAVVGAASVCDVGDGTEEAAGTGTGVSRGDASGEDIGNGGARIGAETTSGTRRSVEADGARTCSTAGASCVGANASVCGDWCGDALKAGDDEPDNRRPALRGEAADDGNSAGMISVDGIGTRNDTPSLTPT